ncbi:MAG: hypothetical protein Q9181_007659, partial [Wetmoreana brouardii]
MSSYNYCPADTFAMKDYQSVNSNSDEASAIDCSITLDGRSLSITPNLRDALLQLHKSELNHDHWVDAICINQKDLSERSAQVNLMREIYSKASQVVVWLGAEDEETPLCIYLISMFAGISKRILAIPQDEWDYFEYRLQGRLFSAGMPHHMYPEWWEMLARFLERTWFGRLWTLQEVALKSQDGVKILCGSQEVSWEKLVAFADVLTYTGLGNGILEILPGPKQGRVGHTVGAYADFQNMCRGKKIYELQHEQLWGLTPHLRATGRIQITLIEKLLTKPPPAQNTGAVLLFLISQCKVFQVTDPRDHVFALLGIAQMIMESSVGHGSQLPVADYARSVENVYRMAFSFITKATQRPYNMAFAGDVGTKHFKDLPSWVPDLTNMPALPLLQIVRRDPERRFNAAGDQAPPPITLRDNNRVLVLHGVQLDSITCLAERNVDI